jgi:RNA polymerase sigma factor (sigma-70 family)
VAIQFRQNRYSSLKCLEDGSDINCCELLPVERTLPGMSATNHPRDSPDDADLLRRCRDGDAAAFGTLFDRHADAVYRFSFRRTGSWHGAEELVSITFLEAWRQRHTLRLHQDSLLPWLLGVATNAHRNQRRSQARYEAFLAKLPPLEQAPDIAEAASARVDQERAMSEVLAALSVLSEKDRDAFILYVAQDQTYEEVAAALDIPVGTVRSRLHRARKKLRQRLRPTTPFTTRTAESGTA